MDLGTQDLERAVEQSRLETTLEQSGFHRLLAEELMKYGRCSVGRNQIAAPCHRPGSCGQELMAWVGTAGTSRWSRRGRANGCWSRFTRRTSSAG